MLPVPPKAGTQEASFRVDSPHKDPSCLGMTTAGEREKLIMFEIKSDGYQASRFVFGWIDWMKSDVILVRGKFKTTPQLG